MDQGNSSSLYFTVLIAALIILVLLTAFFAGSETALTTFRRTKLKPDSKENPRIFEYLKKWLKRPNEILITILLGTNIVITLASSIATVLTDKVLKDSGIVGSGMVIVISSLFITVILLIFGEITPKIIARNNSEKFSKNVIIPIYYLSVILTPIVWFFSSISILISRLLGIKTSGESLLITEEDIKTFVDVGKEEGIIEEEEKEMIHSIFDFGDSMVNDVMVPRTSVFALESSVILADILDKIIEVGYSRMPVYETKIDNIIGVLYIKDILTRIKSGDLKVTVGDCVREAYFVPETKLLIDLLKEFREKKIHMAIVLDEYGGTSGIVTNEDLLEEIVGDIKDEYDDEEQEIIKRTENEFVVKSILDIETINKELEIEIPESEEYDTLSGYIYFKLGKIPEKGDIVFSEKYELQVLEIEKNAIREVLITKLDGTGESENAN